MPPTGSSSAPGSPSTISTRSRSTRRSPPSCSPGSASCTPTWSASTPTAARSRSATPSERRARASSRPRSTSSSASTARTRWSPCAVAVGSAAAPSSSGCRSLAPVTELAERLGYPPDAKLVIVNCDDLGSSRSANVAVYDAMRNGLATSASLMVPCPWARDAAAQYRGEDVGVHLTLNAEWETYRWGPITHAPSLLDGDGGFPRTVEDTWDHADLDEVRRELRAQLERAIL